MIICLDVHYREIEVVAAAVGIHDWSDSVPSLERVQRSNEPPAAYIPGQFYLRELPLLVNLITPIRSITSIVVDGYVWLGRNRAGLGAHLYEDLGRRYSVIGVAKTAFRGNDAAIELTRGASTRPLYVTSAGMELTDAVQHIASMHGHHRIPTILKYVDHLTRHP